MTSRADTTCAGYTLIELLVVVAVLGLVLALFAGSGSMRSTTLDARAAAADLAGGLREARSRAIATNRPVSLTLDIDAHRWRIEGSPPRLLPPFFALALLTTQGEVRSPHIGDIRFEPDGSSTGGRIELDDRHRKLAIAVDWLTGNVRIADER